MALWPTGGPRGLIRVYAPYLDQPQRTVFNFFAVEPIVDGRRDLSELQISSVDHKKGKTMWTADRVDLAHPPAFTATPARGVVSRDGNASVLTLFVLVEKFDNGAEPVVQLTLRSERPHEITLRTFSAAGGAPMSSCVLTATMGNWSRLRHLQLNDRTVDAADVFHSETTNDWGFFPWHDFPAGALKHATGSCRSARRRRRSSESVRLADGVALHRPGGDTSLVDRRSAGVVARVNGRSTFWGTHAAIPDGPAFENFELTAPFQSGEAFRYSVEPR